LRRQPRAIFDVCPSPPLNWSEFASQNLVDLARAGVPAEIVSMPLAGATAPVTLAGSVVQRAAECISGIVIHQLGQPGAPIVWGGAPAIFDMRTGKTPMGAIETAMLDLGCAEVGKYLGLPTHAYLVAGDGRVIDAQVEMESGMSTILGALAGINMISGAGMLDFLACPSIEKLVIDAEAIASAQRLIEGIDARTDSLAVTMFAQTGLTGDFLKLKETRSLFRKEQHFPSAVIDRGLPEMDGATPDILQRTRHRVDELLSAYERHPLLPHYLYVTCYDGSTLFIIDLTSANFSSVSKQLDAKPQGVAAGVNGLVLITTVGTGTGAEVLITYDPATGKTQGLSVALPRPVAPALPSTNNNIYLVGKSRLQASADGKLIVG